MSHAKSPEKVVQEIRRKTRRQFSAEEKIRIVLEGLRGEESIAALCRREGLKPESLLPVEQRVPRSREEAARRRHDARSDVDGSDGPAIREWPAQARGGRAGLGESAVKKGGDGLRLGERYVRRTAAEKYALIRLVEGSELPVRQTLRELRINRSTFYTWYHRYLQRGRAGLEPTPSVARRYWNRIPPRVRQRVVDAALADPERSPRELAWQLTDREGHFLSESSVYRILKAYDLMPSPAFIVLSAGRTFQHPTHRPNELWQTDFTYLQVVG